VKDAVFVVSGRTAALQRSERLFLWDWSDPAVTDVREKHGKTGSLRLDNPKINARIYKKQRCAPFRQLNLSVWIKTKDFQAPDGFHSKVFGKTQSHWNVKPTQDWKQYHSVFNTKDHSEIEIYVGAWGVGGGTLWFDELYCEEIAFFNLVRRRDCPLVVKNTSGVVYIEGRDFEPILSNKSLTLSKNSRIKDRETLLISYFHSQ
jgi:hypothetical protein